MLIDLPSMPGRIERHVRARQRRAGDPRHLEGCAVGVCFKIIDHSDLCSSDTREEEDRREDGQQRAPAREARRCVSG